MVGVVGVVGVEGVEGVFGVVASVPDSPPEESLSFLQPENANTPIPRQAIQTATKRVSLFLFIISPSCKNRLSIKRKLHPYIILRSVVKVNP